MEKKILQQSEKIQKAKNSGGTVSTLSVGQKLDNGQEKQDKITRKIRLYPTAMISNKPVSYLKLTTRLHYTC